MVMRCALLIMFTIFICEYSYAVLEDKSFEELLELAQGNSSSRFEAILKLRDLGDSRAVPVLEKILKEYNGTGYIFGFAAAQALFCIGTQESHNILKRYLLDENYNVNLGINYTFHWNMEESKRDAFIEQYHAKNISDDLKIELEANTSHENYRQKINFIITLRNISDKPLRVDAPYIYKANCLLFRSNEEHFIDKEEIIRYKIKIPDFSERFVRLLPGDTFQFYITGKPFYIKTVYRSCFGLPILYVLHCQEVVHEIFSPGKFTVCAIFYSDPRLRLIKTEEIDTSEIWTGRIVSNSVEVDIEPTNIFTDILIAIFGNYRAYF